MVGLMFKVYFPAYQVLSSVLGKMSFNRKTVNRGHNLWEIDTVHHIIWGNGGHNIH